MVNYIKPFTLAYASPHDEKGKRFGKWFKQIGQKTVAVMYPTKGNKGNNKDFDEPNFNFNIVQGTGYIDGGNKWLCFTSTPTAQGQLFELNLLSKGDNGWKPTNEDQKLINEEIDKWVADGCNCMMLCNGVPTLEVMVEQSIGKLFTTTLRVPFAEAPSTEAIQASLAVIQHQLDNDGDIPEQDDPNYKLAFESGLALMLFMDEGREYKRQQPHLAFEGELPTGIKPQLLPPNDVNLPSANSGSRGGYGTTVNGYMPTSERLKDFKELLKDDTLRQIAGHYEVSFLNLCLSLVGSYPIRDALVENENTYEVVKSDDVDLLHQYIEEYPNEVPKGFDLSEVEDTNKLGQLLYGTINGKRSNDRAFKLAIKSSELEPTGNPWKLSGENLDKAINLLDK